MRILDCGPLEDRAALHAALQEALALPDYYGGNLDALNDCLSERPERELIVLRHFSDFAETFGPYGLKLLQVFNNNGWQVLLD